MSAISAALPKEFQQIGTSTWSDILDELGVQGVIGGLARRGGEGRFAAFAATAKGQAGATWDFQPGDLAGGQKNEGRRPGDVVVVCGGGAGRRRFRGAASLCAQRQRV